jgi:SAM-dependent methyltransferase
MGLSKAMEVLKNSVAFARRHGVLRLLREMHYRLDNLWYERRLGVQTTGMVRLTELGIRNSEYFEYTPLGYRAIFSALRLVPLAPAELSFLDIGCGKGRALVAAARFPFRRVRGVEISRELLAIAQGNLARMRNRRALDVQVDHCDATTYDIPEDVNVIYVFNSFNGATLQKVVENILASQARRPRTIYLTYFNTVHFEKLRRTPDYDWIRPLHVGHFFPNYSFSLYELPANRAALPTAVGGGAG